MLLLFGIMAWVGWFITKTTVWIPLQSYFAAYDWQQVPCTIQESRITRSEPTRQERRSRSTTTSTRVEVTFTYSLGGKEYRSSRYDFIGAYSSGDHDEKRAILARYPAGTRTQCWVDPDNPQNAVLNREFSETYVVGSLFSLFLVAGVGGIGWTLFHVFGGAERQRQRRKARRGETPEDAEPQKLKPRVPIARTLIGGSLVAAVWNGLIWFALNQAWKDGELNGCLIVFFIPFMLVGLLLIWATIAPFLMLSNPRLELILSRRFYGKAERVRRLLITVESPDIPILLKWEAEEAEDALVTEEEMENDPALEEDPAMEKDMPDFLTIVDTDQPMLIAEGTARFEVPAGAQDLFDLDEDREELHWTLRTRCEIPRWLDSVEEHTLTIKRG
jgi:hypothetical protein